MVDAFSVAYASSLCQLRHSPVSMRRRRKKEIEAHRERKGKKKGREHHRANKKGIMAEKDLKGRMEKKKSIAEWVNEKRSENVIPFQKG